MKRTFLELQIEKCTRSVFQLDEVYNSCCFKSHWKRIRWQKPIKKLVLLLPQRKIRCATTSLFGVGGSGRRPLESADPGVRRVGAIGTGSNAGLGLGKLYGGRGLGLAGGPMASILASKKGRFRRGK